MCSEEHFFSSFSQLLLFVLDVGHIFNPFTIFLCFFFHFFFFFFLSLVMDHLHCFSFLGTMVDSTLASTVRKLLPRVDVCE